jgi:NAD(P)-dependent dehydrogenase (short-subunit alcohol dehydrogenase family)
MTTDLTGKLAVITGGGAGLGAASGTAYRPRHWEPTSAMPDPPPQRPSTSRRRSAVRMAAYQTSKFAVLGFGDTLRHERAPEGIGVTVMFPGGMITGHLQSSAETRPAGLGATGAQEDDLTAMLTHRPVGADDIVMPEHAIRNLLADLEADEPYFVTHGAIRADYTERHDALVAAIDRMEKS